MILYLKNYKGFEEAYIPVQDINFFVGDNSTGKTSIISLLKILDDSEFWNSSSFKDIDIFGKKQTTGFFDNILNKKSNEKEFKIGICCNKETDKYFDAISITFINRDNLPIISKLKYQRNNFDITANRQSNNIEYTINKTENKIKNIKKFKKWISENKKSKIKIIETNEIVNSKTNSISQILNLINDKEFGKSRKIRIENIFKNLINEPPIRSELKDIYKKDELQRLDLILKANKTKQYLATFGTNACLFDNISIKNIKEDEYSIEIKYKDIELSINNVGFGISQILPTLANILSFENTHYTLQQPEVHLHPKAQSEFGEFMFNSAYNKKNKFIIETHSDFLIDRFRYCLHEKYSNKININFNSQIIFFYKLKNGNNQISIIDILKTGKYRSGKKLRKFREFFINETYNNWEI